MRHRLCIILIDRQHPSLFSRLLKGKAADAKEQQTPPARRKTEDELPEGIRALKTRFSGASPSNNTPSPQVQHTVTPQIGT